MMIKTSNRTVETAEKRAFALTDMVPYGWDARTDQSGSINVSTNTSYGLPAFYRAVRFYAETIANMRLYAWTGAMEARVRADRTRQGRLFLQVPNPKQSRFDFWETIGEALIVPRNAYIWKNIDPATGLIAEWWALDPAQVEPIMSPGTNGELRWRVSVKGTWVDPVGRGPGVYVVGRETLIHIKGSAGHGQLSTSLIDQYRESLAADIARQRYESASFGRGVKLDYVITVPQGMGRQQMQEFRDNLRQTHGGPTGERVAVLGGGADVKPISMTNTDAELVALSHLSVERAAQIVGVPARLLGVTMSGQDRATLEDVLTEWYMLGVGPMLGRVESALLADPDVFPNPTGPVYPNFMTDGFIRGDVMTEATIMLGKVQSGQYLVDEARAMQGMPPLPDGAGKVPQVVPVGGMANPNQGQPAPGNTGQ